VNPAGPNNPQNKDDPHRWLDAEILRRLIELNPISSESKDRDKIYVPEEISRQISVGRLGLLLTEFERIRSRAGSPEKVDVLNLRLSARGYPGLFDYILKAGAFSVGNSHRAVRLLDFGAESLVFFGENRAGVPVAIKIPFLDFTNLGHLAVDQLLRRRRRLVHEGNMLRALEGTAFPRFIASHVGHNFFFPSRIPSFLSDSEQFLVIEYVKGLRVDALARLLHKHNRGCCVLHLAVKFAATFFDLSEEIAVRIGPKSVYTDIKPENALVQETEIRIVDASSIIPGDLTEPSSFSVSEAYLDPIDHQKWKIGKLVPQPAYVVRSVVRIVRALVANTTLFVGQPSPAWPSDVPVDPASTLNSLATDLKIDLRRAAEVSHALLERLTCQHGAFHNLAVN